MAEPDADSTGKPDIPFLFYDVIGRMMPGAYLIFGAFLCWVPFISWQQFVSCIKEVQALGMTGGVAVTVVGTGLLLFGFVSAFFGFLLAALSKAVVDIGIWHWSRLDYPGMEKFLGSETAHSLNTRFKKIFGSEPTKTSLNRSSFLCAYYIWRTNVNLGQMQGRHDSDLLAAQSFVLVTIALILAVAYEMWVFGPSRYFRWWLAALIVIGLGSVLSFNYHRKKRVYGRFELFLALSDPLPEGDDKKHAPES
jgi:hypothetical protein